MLDNIWVIIIVIAFIFVFASGILFPKVYRKRKPGQASEKNTLRLIRQFIKQRGWKKTDYLLVSNLILQKKNYWSCEIDLILLTRKWVYIIEVKGWKRGRLSGKLNDEYLELSYKIGKKQQLQRQQMYSPFYQNETHIKRFKNYFQSESNHNILSVICFNSPYLSLDLTKNKNSIFTSKHLWISNGRHKDITDLLVYCEKQNTQLPFFTQLKAKIRKEVLNINPQKSQKHRVWVKSLRVKNLRVKK